MIIAILWLLGGVASAVLCFAGLSAGLEWWGALILGFCAIGALAMGVYTFLDELSYRKSAGVPCPTRDEMGNTVTKEFLTRMERYCLSLGRRRRVAFAREQYAVCYNELNKRNKSSADVGVVTRGTLLTVIATDGALGKAESRFYTAVTNEVCDAATVAEFDASDARGVVHDLVALAKERQEYAAMYYAVAAVLVSVMTADGPINQRERMALYRFFEIK